MNIRKRTFGTSIIAFLCGAVGSALAQAPQKVVAKYHTWWLPDEGTLLAGKVDFLFNLILWITSIVFVLVFVVMIYFLIKYRAREGRKAIYHHGNTRLEIIWTIIPAIIVIALGFASKSLWSQMKQDFPTEDQALVVDVKPRQFQWDITYAGADGKFGTPDDITTTNQLHVPAGKPVLVKLTAQDVIHSFFVPEFRIKQDAVPGMVTKSWFNVPTPGNYEIACAELCGLGHYRMRGYLTVHSQQDFDKWYADQMAAKAKELAPPPPAPAADTAAASASAPAKKDTAASATASQAAGTAAASDTAKGGKSDTAATK